MPLTRKPKDDLSRQDVLRVVSERIKRIDYDFSKFTIPDFTQWVANQRGIDIHLEPCEGLTSPTGFWFISDDGAHIMYSAALSRTLEIITILHELLHIYFGHETVYIAANYPLLGSCQGAATRDASQQSRDDQEAEIGAILIYQRFLSGDSSAATNPVSNLFKETD